MPDASAFTCTAPELAATLAELLACEPIFHRPALASTADDFARMTAPDYWEVGASGRRYSRGFVLDMLARIPPLDAAAAGWRLADAACRELGPATFLLTYTLHQGERVSRRSTIWRRANEDWEVLFHQGTIVAVEEDDTAPPELLPRR